VRELYQLWLKRFFIPQLSWLGGALMIALFCLFSFGAVGLAVAVMSMIIGSTLFIVRTRTLDFIDAHFAWLISLPFPRVHLLKASVLIRATGVLTLICTIGVFAGFARWSLTSLAPEVQVVSKMKNSSRQIASVKKVTRARSRTEASAPSELPTEEVQADPYSKGIFLGLAGVVLALMSAMVLLVGRGRQVPPLTSLITHREKPKAKYSWMKGPWFVVIAVLPLFLAGRGVPFATEFGFVIFAGILATSLASIAVWQFRLSRRSARHIRDLMLASNLTYALVVAGIGWAVYGL
jgi:hypothetical protein